MSVTIIGNVLAKNKIITNIEENDVTSLYEALKRAEDPRQKRGVWYPFCGLLLICAAAVVYNARSITVIHEWAKNAAAKLPLEASTSRSVCPGWCSPGVTPVLQITRAIHGSTADKSSAEIVYAVTSIPEHSRVCGGGWICYCFCSYHFNGAYCICSGSDRRND